MWDLARFALRALTAHRLRSGLSMLGIAIGVASVVLLTSVGEGTRRYIFAQFSQFGTNLLSINPGKSETLGIPGVLGGTTHKLTLEDALALARLPEVTHVVPMAFGSARVEARGRARNVFLYGITPEVVPVWKVWVERGSFWPDADPRRGQSAAILGPTLARELFGSDNPLGETVRISEQRYRVVGVMNRRGNLLGIDVDDTIYIPTVSAMRLLNTDELVEIHVQYLHGTSAKVVVEGVTGLLTARHGGREDFTVTTQEAMLSVFDNVMNAITGAVGAIASISLLVGAVGILTTLWIAVGERTHEIGLLRALGVGRAQVRGVFLIEAAVLATLGGALGLSLGLGLTGLLAWLVPGLPVSTPLEYAAAALAAAAVTGLLAGVIPAARAARLDPIEALRAE